MVARHVRVRLPNGRRPDLRAYDVCDVYTPLDVSDSLLQGSVGVSEAIGQGFSRVFFCLFYKSDLKNYSYRAGNLVHH